MDMVEKGYLKEPCPLYVLNKTKTITQKCIPTLKALDDWVAQLYGLDLDSIPNKRPEYIP